MEPEITFISVYRCPRCEAPLEAVETPGSGWLRCPKCGRPSLPPPYTLTRWVPRRPGPTGSQVAGATEVEDLLWIPAIAEEARTKPAGWVKVVLFMAVVAVPMIVCVALGREPIETSMLGVVTALAMLLLLRPGEGR